MKFKRCKSCGNYYGPHLPRCPRCGKEKFKMCDLWFIPRPGCFARVRRKILGLFPAKKEVRPIRE